MKNFLKNENGSVMMETLLVLPLHLLLLFGVMWISMLSYDQLVFAQYSFTLQGSNAAADEIRSKLWGDDNYIRTETPVTAADSSSWWKQSSGSNLERKFPAYLEGLRILSGSVFQAERPQPDGMRSQAGLNTFYSKNNAYATARADVKTAETPAWSKIAREEFPTETTVHAGEVKTLSPYTRNQAFIHWSTME